MWRGDARESERAGSDGDGLEELTVRRMGVFRECMLKRLSDDELMLEVMLR